MCSILSNTMPSMITTRMLIILLMSPHTFDDVRSYKSRSRMMTKMMITRTPIIKFRDPPLTPYLLSRFRVTQYCTRFPAT